MKQETERVQPMFSLSFDSSHRVLLAKFAGVLSTEDIEDFDNALAAFVSRHGLARGIFDFSSVQANAVPQSFLVWRARLPQILLGQERVIVAPQQEIYELACAYAAQQRDFGNVEGQVVRVLGDAYRMLDLEQADFRPVESV
jgi:hypothetical protein